MFRGALLFVVFAAVNASYEGDTCVQNGVTGVCTRVENCKSAREGISSDNSPQICSFFQNTSIVCCLDNSVHKPVATTTERPEDKTPLYEPETYGYESDVPDMPKCDPVDPTLTKPKTGQKSWDKCVEYQEKLVYPCRKNTALVGGYQRQNYCFHKADDLIVNGEDAAPNEFPHMALLGFGDPASGIGWECGGTLISEKFILTAGSCVFSRNFGAVTYASLGMLSIKQVSPANTYKIKNRFRHPQYRVQFYNDIALLELEQAVNLTEFIVPACLHTGAPVDDSRATATGWNLLAEHNTTSDILQKVTLNKMIIPECENLYSSKRIAYRFDKTTQICYGDKDAPTDIICKGDGGGPLQIKHKDIHCMYLVIGVTSSGTGCTWRKNPGLYSKVAHHIAWIESIVWP